MDVLTIDTHPTRSISQVVGLVCTAWQCQYDGDLGQAVHKTASRLAHEAHVLGANCVVGFKHQLLYTDGISITITGTGTAVVLSTQGPS